MASSKTASTRTASSKATKTATTTKSAGKSSAPVSHPTYADMIQQAISTLNEKKGSSRIAILKYIEAKYKLAGNTQVSAHLRMALKRGVTSGALKQTSGTGASGSFKLGDGKAPATKAAKPSPKKSAPKKKTTSSPKKAAAQPKKAATKTKTATPKKAASPKQKAAAKPKVANKTVNQKKTRVPQHRALVTKH